MVTARHRTLLDGCNACAFHYRHHMMAAGLEPALGLRRTAFAAAGVNSPTQLAIFRLVYHLIPPRHQWMHFTAPARKILPIRLLRLIIFDWHFFTKSMHTLAFQGVNVLHECSSVLATRKNYQLPI